ncbi:TPA: hypothetical protein U5D93_001319 [Yersinia enterocolitica]|nr:hypothetical protein [Yersinia enterocolitica]HEN3391276.1 hypothetical protein [Yersinia enterocolitica]
MMHSVQPPAIAGHPLRLWACLGIGSNSGKSGQSDVLKRCQMHDALVKSLISTAEAGLCCGVTFTRKSDATSHTQQGQRLQMPCGIAQRSQRRVIRARN